MQNNNTTVRIEDFDATLSDNESKQAIERNVASIASQAYQFGLPAFLHMRMLTEFIQGRQYMNPGEVPVGGWILVRTLADPATNNNAPNNDTLYGASYVLLEEQGPVVLTVPAITDRYYSVELLDAYFNNFAVVSSRTYGTNGGQYLIVPPGWNGAVPDGITDVLRSPTPNVVLFQRIFIHNESEYSMVHALQDGITLNPIGEKQYNPVDVSEYAIPNMRGTTDPLQFFTYVNSYTAKNRPPSEDSGLMALFATVGLGPDGKMPQEENLRSAIGKGALEAQATINARISNGPFKNGWRVPDPLIGQLGPHILSRAVAQLTQVGSFVPDEAMYFFADKDGQGSALNGANCYTLTFAKDQLPPIHTTGFWSLTMYNDKWLLAENSINRYVLRPSTPGLLYNNDGSLTMYIQHNEPEDNAKKANWLPAPVENFTVALRTYHPTAEVISGEWFPPAMYTLRKEST